MSGSPCKCKDGNSCVPCRVWGKHRGRPPVEDRLRELCSTNLSRVSFEDELRSELSEALRDALARIEFLSQQANVMAGWALYHDRKARQARAAARGR